MGLFLHIPFPEHRSAARAAGVRRAAAGDAGLRRARISDRDRSRCVPLGGGVRVGRAGADLRQYRDARRPARDHRRVPDRRGRRRDPARGDRIAGHRCLQAHDRRVAGPQAHDRRRPARLQQGPGGALQGLRAFPRDAPGEPEPRDVPADRAAVAQPTCAPTRRSAAISSRPPAAPTAASPTPTGRRSAISTAISRTTCSWASCARR